MNNKANYEVIYDVHSEDYMKYAVRSFCKTEEEAIELSNMLKQCDVYSNVEYNKIGGNCND